MLLPRLGTRLEKAALDNGFDQDRGTVAGWLAFSSTHAAIDIWLTAEPVGSLTVALSRVDVAGALADHGAPAECPLPAGATAARSVPDVQELYRLLRRAYQLARTLPDELLHAFERRTATLPRSTEAERLVVQRVGQDIFREGLLDYWDGRCAITGVEVPELLRASHIKPWAACDTDAERLDVFNGLLLAPNLDALFDGGWLTVLEDGTVRVSARLAPEARTLLGVAAALRAERLTSKHQVYLAWHRAKVFEP